MVVFPEELIDCTHWDTKKGKTILNDGATEEQRGIFEKFYRELDNGMLSDVKISFMENENKE